jgi:hypothetical protein
LTCGRPLNIGRKNRWSYKVRFFFLKTQVPFVMRIETQVPKIKIFKPQVPNMSLTLKIKI